MKNLDSDSFEIYGVEGSPDSAGCCCWGAAALLREGKIYNSVTGSSCRVGECVNALYLMPEPVQIRSISDWRGYYVFAQMPTDESETLFLKVQPQLLDLVRSGEGKPMRIKGDLVLVGSDNLAKVLSFFAQATIDLAESYLAKHKVADALNWLHYCMTFDHLNESALELLVAHGDDTDVKLSRTFLEIIAERKLTSA